MSYSALSTVNPGDTISTVWGNQVKDNFDAHHSGRPGQVIKRDNGSSYTTTSDTFVDIDGTNLAITLTISSGKAQVKFTATFVSSAVANSDGGLDIDVDGTRYGSAFAMGIGKIRQTTEPHTVTLAITVTGLSVGSHTFKPKWRRNSAGTLTAYSGDGGAVTDLGIIFAVEEIG